MAGFAFNYADSAAVVLARDGQALPRALRSAEAAAGFTAARHEGRINSRWGRHLHLSRRRWVKRGRLETARLHRSARSAGKAGRGCFVQLLLGGDPQRAAGHFNLEFLRLRARHRQLHAPCVVVSSEFRLRGKAATPL